MTRTARKATAVQPFSLVALGTAFLATSPKSILLIQSALRTLTAIEASVAQPFSLGWRVNVCHAEAKGWQMWIPFQNASMIKTAQEAIAAWKPILDWEVNASFAAELKMLGKLIKLDSNRPTVCGTHSALKVSAATKSNLGLIHNVFLVSQDAWAILIAPVLIVVGKTTLGKMEPVWHAAFNHILSLFSARFYAFMVKLILTNFFYFWLLLIKIFAWQMCVF